MDTAESQKKAVLGFRKAFKSAPWIAISKMQAQSFRERPLKGSILVSKVKMRRPTHVWNVVMPFLPQSRHSVKLWGKACKELGTAAADDAKERRKSEVWFVKLAKLEMVKRDFEGLLDIPDGEVLKRMRAARDELAKYVWKGPAVGYAKL
ncbi:hypothetical protein VTN00DRAFT_10380 [Thermoascus crustaceus]|uniref:uncharacterized protein n=1 Tax=Thermoascus crustaceus TaxID=5088 RepID=UPI0037432DDA